MITPFNYLVSLTLIGWLDKVTVENILFAGHDEHDETTIFFDLDKRCVVAYQWRCVHCRIINPLFLYISPILWINIHFHCEKYFRKAAESLLDETLGQMVPRVSRKHLWRWQCCSAIWIRFQCYLQILNGKTSQFLTPITPCFHPN